MQLTDMQITKFQTLWKQRFGTEISRAEALERGIKLVRLMGVVYKPMTVSEQEDVLTRQKRFSM